MMGCNIGFKEVILKIIPKLSLLPLLIWSTGSHHCLRYSPVSIFLCVFYFQLDKRYKWLAVESRNVSCHGNTKLWDRLDTVYSVDKIRP